MPTMQQRPWGLLVLGNGLLGAMDTAAAMGNPNLWTAGVLGPACQVWAPEEQYSSAVGTG
jgi:hypothetical protein